MGLCARHKPKKTINFKEKLDEREELLCYLASWGVSYDWIESGFFEEKRFQKIHKIIDIKKQMFCVDAGKK